MTLIKINSSVSRNVITVPADETVSKALMIMKSHHFRHLPVVNDDGFVVGIISDRDLYRGLNFDEKSVTDVMNTHLLKVNLDAEIKTVILKMLESKVSALLVLDQNNFVGIITTEDILLSYLHLLENSEDKHTLMQDLMEFVKKSII